MDGVQTGGSMARMIVAVERSPSRSREEAIPPAFGRSVADPTGFDRQYWLAHCEGYRVDAAEGRLGFVEQVRPQEAGEPPTLAVRAGRLGRRLMLVSAAEVAFIVPRTRRIWLRSPVAIVGSDPVASLASGNKPA
jgi:hypothetical protein